MLSKTVHCSPSVSDAEEETGLEIPVNMKKRKSVSDLRLHICPGPT
jgi:hypothetical protein